ncbi:FecR domain-containing protein [Sphingomonas sp. H39-1-10]|uniref:FecR family protein n=1 Tax=Sphingomonas pollutisoli TaxID=3030829 RepID=UPI0023BA2F1F|nr:FecR domain-containing protein [Sphingomonas pollutisoli]MDF0488518.1 FecR domain-containing protein [Sphingomonas pollutisoli]
MSEPITRGRLATLSPAEAAALWCVQKDQGIPLEAGLFEEWLEQSQANRAAWQSVESAWGVFDTADDADLAELRHAALAVPPVSRWYDVRDHWRPVAAAVAVFVVLIAGGRELGRRPVPSGGGIATTPGATPENQIFETKPTPQRFALADGTTMALGADTLARASMSAESRVVTLERGTVTLAVAHDASRPFQVVARDRRILDIGTRFQVALGNGAMRVVLFEGSVRIEGGDATRVLRPGEQLIARPGKPDVITRVPPGEAGGGELVQLDNVTLAAAAAAINQGSALKLVVPDPKIAQLRVSGRFRAGDPEHFARSVSALLSLQVVRVGPTRLELRRLR